MTDKRFSSIERGFCSLAKINGVAKKIVAEGICLIGLIAGAGVSAGLCADIFVAADGNDANPGTKEKPLATPAGARDAVRKSGKLGKEPVTVTFAAGSYYLPETLAFKPEDSGDQKAPVVYKSDVEGKAIISGGRKLDLKWEPYKDGIMKARTPEGLKFDQLFVNGERQHMARYPNYDPNIATYNGFAADAFSKERAARWKNPAGGFIHAMHSAHWGGFHYLITGKKPDGEVTYEGGWQNNRKSAMHPKERFVENIFEELDAPNEWFHNAEEKTLYFFPPQGLDLNKAKIEVVVLAKLVDFAGSKEKPVKWISLNGFTFQHAARTFMDNKEPLLRSDWTIYRGGAVTFTGASDCVVSDCKFDAPGGNAAFVNKWNRRITFRGCHFTEVGASGVAFVGDPASVRNPLFEYNQKNKYADIDKTPGPKTDNYPEDCLVEDCLMARTGRIEKQGAGVHLSMSHKITVRHCSIYDTSRSGININEGTFGGHVIEFCDVFDTVRETGDHGSFNSWGRDRYWVLPGAPDQELPQLAKLDIMDTNILRNSRWRCDRGWDIDLDDGSSYYEIYNNLLLHGGLKLREGFGRKAYNNIMVNNSLHAHCWFANCGDVVRNNILMASYRSARMESIKKWGQEVDYNIFTSEADRKRFAAQGCDEHSIVADVKFVDPAKGDFRVKDECKAVFDLGFKNFPMDQFGVQKPSLKAIARTPEMPVPGSVVDVKPESGKKGEGAKPSAGGKKGGRAAQESSKEVVWQGARVKTIEGEEYSAYGTAKEDGGVSVLEAPAGCFAAVAGLKAGDLIAKLNGEKTRNTDELFAKTNAAAGKPLALEFVRDQQPQTANMTKYVYCVVERAANGEEFKAVPLKKQGECAAFKAVTANIKTNNDPLASLADGKLGAGYGPVFSNGEANGIYKIDLGEAKDIRSFSSWTFNQGGGRGSMNFIIYGCADADPGWDLKKCVAMVQVFVKAGAQDKFLASRAVESAGGSLGKFRWLLVKTSPVNAALVENTAFQEFQVEAK